LESVKEDEEREEQQVVKFDDLQRMSTAIERTQGHYEVQETSYGEAYVWCPECVVVDCDSGERPVLSASESTCECGADHASLIREELASRRPSEKTLIPGMTSTVSGARSRKSSCFQSLITGCGVEVHGVVREYTGEGILAFAHIA
jgi:hypothetical protein